MTGGLVVGICFLQVESEEAARWVFGLSLRDAGRTRMNLFALFRQIPDHGRRVCVCCWSIERSREAHQGVLNAYLPVGSRLRGCILSILPQMQYNHRSSTRACESSSPTLS
jgi:hypothetical protein